MDYTTDFHYKNPFLKHSLATSLAFTGSFEYDNTIDVFKSKIFSSFSYLKFIIKELILSEKTQ